MGIDARQKDRRPVHTKKSSGGQGQSLQPVAAWFWAGAGLTFLILVVGGITRLTESGLSMVDWEPITGILPPMGEQAWVEAFDRYRLFPEYQQLRQGMALGEFKFIYFWEYLHRMLARLIGIVFLVPFLYFWIRGYFDRKLRNRAFVLFGLGGLQGVAGWFMVASGLIDQPHVSHYRLAVHLAIAFAIFGCCVWFALDLGQSRAPEIPRTTKSFTMRGMTIIGSLLFVQVFWGALVAGLKAGYILNTFPLMDGSLVPSNLFWSDPPLLNFLENPVAVQWLHRGLGTLLGIASIVFYLRGRRRLAGDTRAARINASFLLLILGQYALGVMTLLFRVPVPLGVAHQAMAMVLFAVWLTFVHRARSWRVKEEIVRLTAVSGA